MKVYVRKNNTNTNKEFIIPKNDSYNCKNWIHITIDNLSKKFIAEKTQDLIIEEDEWEVKDNYTFPSSLLNEFLRNDYLEI